MTPEEQAEEDRRKMREKLAKVHRFLGSRVPPHLVLGFDIPSPECLLPPAACDSDILAENDNRPRKAWLRARRSSSVAIFPSNWSDNVDRMKEDLNVKEKAINVRRAQKMERVFGVAPPKTLYQTRRSISPTTSPTSYFRNPNRSAYPPRTKDNRPGTSDSTKQLLPKIHDSRPYDDSIGRSSSVVYTHYQHSITSLNDILDRGDRESLAELHEYLNSGDGATTPLASSSYALSPLSPIGRCTSASSSSNKSDRRHSLPVRAPRLSISSEYSITSPKPEPTNFQLRRRRAAKLLQFFGVNYRELIHDVLERIENGLEHEQNRGTLRPDEVEDLLARLRDLKTRRDGVF